MKTNFTAARWRGRMLGTLICLAKFYYIRFENTQDATFLNLYLRVLEKAKEHEKVILSSLMNQVHRLSEAEEKDGNVPLKQRIRDKKR